MAGESGSEIRKGRIRTVRTEGLMLEEKTYN
jgi:hypothetical protein